LKILVLEPYYGGSHKTFLDDIQAYVPVDLSLLTLPARKWKWRMRLAAPYFADKIISLGTKEKFDAVFCSSFVDVATLRSLLPYTISQLPFCTYFHENQFVYPVQKEDERDFHFGLTNLTTALASDRVGFNTQYNLQTFLTGVERILKICPDMKLKGVIEKIKRKSSVLYPGIDFSHIDAIVPTQTTKSEAPVIVWNHRWEHDKNPKLFFKTLLKLDEQNIDFRLIIVGQSFKRQPAIFSEAQERLKHRIIHYGFVESKDEYASLLRMSDIAVSTAEHEFYGISVIEAVRAGCHPVLPARLSYPELFPAEYLYEDGELFSRLKVLLENPGKLHRSRAQTLTECFSWPALKGKYLEWFGGTSQNTGLTEHTLLRPWDLAR
jgi:glycosyltransferase involved in cell wall biosynthesis